MDIHFVYSWILAIPSDAKFSFLIFWNSLKDQAIIITQHLNKNVVFGTDTFSRKVIVMRFEYTSGFSVKISFQIRTFQISPDMHLYRALI